MAPQLTATNGPLLRGERLVDRARHELLAGPGLAEDEHRRRHARDLTQEPANALHSRGLSERQARAVAGERQGRALGARARGAPLRLEARLGDEVELEERTADGAEELQGIQVVGARSRGRDRGKADDLGPSSEEGNHEGRISEAEPRPRCAGARGGRLAEARHVFAREPAPRRRLTRRRQDAVSTRPGDEDREPGRPEALRELLAEAVSRGLGRGRLHEAQRKAGELPDPRLELGEAEAVVAHPAVELRQVASELERLLFLLTLALERRFHAATVPRARKGRLSHRPERGLDPLDQQERGEGLRQEVVGARRARLDLVLRPRAREDDEPRMAAVRRLERSQNGDAVHRPEQPEVEDDELGRRLLGESEGVRTVYGLEHLVLAEPEHLAKQVANVRVIVHHENPRHSTSPGSTMPERRGESQRAPRGYLPEAPFFAGERAVKPRRGPPRPRDGSLPRATP